MEALCEQLDQVVLDIFQLLEDLNQKQDELEQALKDGYFSMARARYNIGVKRITADQIIDADLTANQTVDINGNDHDGGSFEDENRKKEDDTTQEHLQDLFSLDNGRSLDDAGSKTINTLSKENEESGVRKRGTGTLSVDKDMKKLDKTIEDEGKKFKLRNPIHLFGVLVPQALRSCQSSFEAAVKLSVEVANQKYKLGILQEKLNHLKHRKTKLKSLDDSPNSKCVENES